MAAEFISTNSLVPARVVKSSPDRIWLKSGDHEFVLEGRYDIREVTSEALLCTRPEDIQAMNANEKPDANLIHATIGKIDFAGSTLVIKLQSDLERLS